MAQGTRHTTVRGVLQEVAGVGIIDAYGTGAPTASAAGYATGCTYHRIDGSTDTSLYVNEGTKDSATWVVVTTT
jgi:outer membrane receptor for Fe3+-dicitrate